MRSTSKAEIAGYSAAQVALHWAVVGLIVVQVLSHDAMEDAWDAVEDGYAPPGLPVDPIALLHALSGALILVLMLVRFTLRLRHGAPPLPPGTPPIVSFAAHANHFVFYGILVLLPLSGTAAILLGIEDAADLHGTLVLLLFVLIAMHVGGVIYHTVLRRDGLIWRMLVPRR